MAEADNHGGTEGHDEAIVPATKDAESVRNTPIVGADSGKGVSKGFRLKRISERLGLFLAAVTALSFVGAALTFLLDTPQLMLTVWFQEFSPIYPSKTTDGIELPLEVAGEPVHSAEIVKVNVSNTGKQLIGTQADTWVLKLTTQEGTHLRLVGEPESKPNHELVARWNQSQVNELQLYIRSLDTGSAVSLRLLVLNGRPKFIVAPSLAGLPLERTMNSPAARKRDRLVLPFIILFLALLSIEDGLKRWRARGDKKLEFSWRQAIGRIIILAIIGGGATAALIGEIVSWFD